MPRRNENAVKNLHFLTYREQESIAQFQEVVSVPIPDRGDLLEISEGRGYVPTDESELDFDTESLGTFLVKDIEYSYQYLDYPESEEKAVERLFCTINVYVEPVRSDR